MSLRLCLLALLFGVVLGIMLALGMGIQDGA